MEIVEVPNPRANKRTEKLISVKEVTFYKQMNTKARRRYYTILSNQSRTKVNGGTLSRIFSRVAEKCEKNKKILIN